MMIDDVPPSTSAIGLSIKSSLITNSNFLLPASFFEHDTHALSVLGGTRTIMSIIRPFRADDLFKFNNM